MIVWKRHKPINEVTVISRNRYAGVCLSHADSSHTRICNAFHTQWISLLSGFPEFLIEESAWLSLLKQTKVFKNRLTFSPLLLQDCGLLVSTVSKHIYKLQVRLRATTELSS